MHPTRLLDRLELLGAGPVHGRGRFWLPCRSDRVCAWDGAGGQLAVGDIGAWGLRSPDTRLVITGTGTDPVVLLCAFEEALLTDSELARGLHCWDGLFDGWEEWLGDRADEAL